MLLKKVKPSSAACLSCRERHLKCDGQMPVCARCASSGSGCVFVQSRRGQRGETSRIPDTSSAISSATASILADSQQNSLPDLPHVEDDDQQQPSRNTLNEDTTSSFGPDHSTTDDEYLIGLYYRYIHPSHPFVLPQDLYHRRSGLYPAHLKRAMCFIASHHATDCRCPCPEISSIVSGTGIPKDAFAVQSLILITLGSYARFERDRGNSALSAAIALASEINLQSDSFGHDHEDLFRESWRRTWWELYIITAIISLIGGTNVRLSQPQTLTLPYACEIYHSCRTSQAGNIEQMQQRFYSVPGIDWSSFAYRIEATRIFATVLDGASDPQPSNFDAINASISSFLLSLPATKCEGLKDNGDVDEVMICALMIIHLARICLNFPRSKLARRGFTTVCGTDRGKVASGREASYSAASLSSAQALTKLISLHTSLKTLSPCFACAVAFSAVVQLSEYASQTPPRPPYLQENLQLQLSALQSLGETWPIAHVVRSQLAQFFREISSETQTQPTAGAEPMAMFDPLTREDQWLQELMSEEMLLDGASIPFFTMPDGP